MAAALPAGAGDALRTGAHDATPPTLAASTAAADATAQEVAAAELSTHAARLAAQLAAAHTGAAQQAAAEAACAWCESSAVKGSCAIGSSSLVRPLLRLVRDSTRTAAVAAALRALRALALAGRAARDELHASDALVLSRRVWRHTWTSPTRTASGALCDALTRDAAELACAYGALDARALVAQLREDSGAVLALRRHACCGRDAREALLAAGALPPLLALLTRVDAPLLAEAAADTLAELAAQPPANDAEDDLEGSIDPTDDTAVARAMLSAGALRPLLTLMSGAAGATAAEVAAGAIYDVLRVGEAAALQALIAADGFRILVALLRGAQGAGAAATAANCVCYVRQPEDGDFGEQGGDGVGGGPAARAWVDAGGMDALMNALRGALGDFAAHSSALALAHYVSGNWRGGGGRAAASAVPAAEAATTLVAMLRGSAGEGAARHAANTLRALMLASPTHRREAVAAGVAAAAAAMLPAALELPLPPQRAFGARHPLHAVAQLLLLLLSPAIPAADAEADAGHAAIAAEHTRRALLAQPGALAGLVRVAASMPHIAFLRALIAVSSALPHAECALFDGHFAWHAIASAWRSIGGGGDGGMPWGSTALGSTGAPATLLSLAHPPDACALPAAAALAQLARAEAAAVERTPQPERQFPFSALLCGGARLEMLTLGALDAACEQPPVQQWRREALCAALTAAAAAAGLLATPAGDAGADEPPRKRRRGCRESPPRSSTGDNTGHALTRADVNVARADTTVFLVAGRAFHAHAAALQRASRLVARLLADAPPAGGGGDVIPIPPISGVPIERMFVLFSAAVEHAYTGGIEAAPEAEALLPLWLLASFLEMDALQAWAAARLAVALRGDAHALLAAWREAQCRPGAGGLRAACCRALLATGVDACVGDATLADDDSDDEDVPMRGAAGNVRLLRRMRAAEEAPGTLRDCIAAELRAALLARSDAHAGAAVTRM
jgi:hypothetical protein